MATGPHWPLRFCHCWFGSAPYAIVELKLLSISFLGAQWRQESSEGNHGLVAAINWYFNVWRPSHSFTGSKLFCRLVASWQFIYNIQLYAAITMYTIWLTRNQTLHNSSKPDIAKILRLIRITFYNPENGWMKLASPKRWRLATP